MQHVELKLFTGSYLLLIDQQIGRISGGQGGGKNLETLEENEKKKTKTDHIFKQYEKCNP